MLHVAGRAVGIHDLVIDGAFIYAAVHIARRLRVLHLHILLLLLLLLWLLFLMLLTWALLERDGER